MNSSIIDFLNDLFQALLVVALSLERISFTFNGLSLRLFDVIGYSCVITTVMGLVKNMSYHGLFTISRENRDKLGRGMPKNGD